MKKFSNKYLHSENKNIIKVNKININLYDSPVINSIKNSLLSKKTNNIKSFKNNEPNIFIYKKPFIENQNSIYQIYNNKNANKIYTLGNNENKNSIPLFFISPRNNLNTMNNRTINYSSYRKKFKTHKKINNPICQLYYKKNNNKIYNKTVYDSFFVKSKTIKNNSNKNSNFTNKTKLMNTSSTSALSFSESNNNLYNNAQSNAMKTIINSKSVSHFSNNYSLDKNIHIYKKVTITPFKCYSFDDNQITQKEKEKEKSINQRICTNIIDNMPLVTFGNDIIDNTKIISKQNNQFKKNNNNSTNDQYILQLKKENELLKDALIKTNERIKLLEDKIDNKIKNIHIKEKLYDYANNSNNLNKSIIKKRPISTPYIQKLLKKDILQKEKKIIKIKVNSKEDIKSVVNRIFRNDERKGKKKNNSNNNLKNKK